jgi:hypothetical protein
MTPQRHLTLRGTLRPQGGRALPIRAMLDSGANSNFIDQGFIKRHNIPLTRKESLMPLRVIDGSPITSGGSSHHIQPCKLSFGDHHETISLDAIPLGDHDIVLGIPWLRHHNPRVDWAREALKMRPGAALAGSATYEPSPEVLTAVPKEYHDFAFLFEPTATDSLPKHQPWDHSIPLMEGKSPPFGPIYQLSEKELQALRKQLDKDLARGFIEPSTSPAAAPVIFTAKKSGELRMCVDYRGLNAITIKNRYPLPLINELFDRLRSARYFTRVDLRGAYNLIRMKLGEEWKTAFRCRYGHFQYKVLPLGLTNAPASFQALINDTLKGCLDQYAIAFLDDIGIFSNSYEEHVKHVRDVLERLARANLFIQLDKCEFHKSEMTFLGFVVGSGGIKMDPEKVAAITSWPTPRNKRELQAFLGFTNFYRRFIKGYSRVARGMTDLLRGKNRKFLWTAIANQAFHRLKAAFLRAGVIKHFDPERPAILEADASDRAIAGCLSQKDAVLGRLHPVAFYSRKLTPPEENYDIYDKELLAIVECLRQWRVYLEGASEKTTIYSDHQNLERFTTTKVLNRRQARWAEMLGSYNFVIVHRPGRDNTKADLLSRRPDYFPDRDSAARRPDPPVLRPEQWSLAATELNEVRFPRDENFIRQIQEAYDSDRLCREGLVQARTSSRGEKDREWELSKEGLLLRRGLVFIPDSSTLRARVLRNLHDSPTAGHLGRERTIELVSREFDFENMNRHVRAFIATCDVCGRLKPDRHKPYGALKSLSVPQGPWDSITMDFVVKLPPSRDPSNPRAPPFDSILVVVDRFTKMSHLIPCHETITGPQLAHLIVRHVIAHHGAPTTIISDRGKPFMSKFTRSLCRQLDIDQRFSTAYHPQTDGQTERTNQTMEQYLRAYCNYLQDDWVELLPMGEFCLNNAKQASTKHSAFFANYGRHPKIRARLRGDASVPAAEEKARAILETHKTLKRTLEEAQRSQAKHYDRRRAARTPEFRPGSKVWLRATNIRTERPSAKLDDKKLGPFTITHEVGTLARRLALPPSMKIHPVFHISLLEPYKELESDRPVREEPRPTVVDGEEEWEVDEVVDSRRRKRGRGSSLEYKVKWRDTPLADSSWEPARNLANAQQAVRAFHHLHPSKPGPDDR